MLKLVSLFSMMGFNWATITKWANAAFLSMGLYILYVLIRLGKSSKK